MQSNNQARWQCSCGAQNFTSAAECWRCQAPQPTIVTPPPAPPVQAPVAPPVDLVPAQAPPMTDMCAMWSVALSALGLPLFYCGGFLLSIPGLILGIISLVRTYENPRIKGRYLAWIGVALALAPIAFFLFSALLFMSGALSTPSATPTATP